MLSAPDRRREGGWERQPFAYIAQKLQVTTSETRVESGWGVLSQTEVGLQVKEGLVMPTASVGISPTKAGHGEKLAGSPSISKSLSK